MLESLADVNLYQNQIYWQLDMKHAILRKSF